MKRSTLCLLCSSALLAAFAAPAAQARDDGATAQAAKANPFTATEVARFNEPWAMTFLPNGRLLVTEKRGVLKVLTIGGTAQTITGVPTVAYGGQGGLGDVILHPSYATNGLIYISYAEKGSISGTAGATVARAKLNLTSSGGSLSNLQVLWRQPKVSGSNHYGHRLAFGPDRKLWITSSERQKFDPAQDLNSPLGKVIRLNDDGSVPSDNPFYSRGGVAATVWSYGHRNLLGIAFDAQSKLWIHEMGPKGGDELNLIERGSNYGWPLVSQGDHYDGTPIPRHSTRPDLNAPEAWWNPVIAPAGFVIYSGTRFPNWSGSGLIGGLASQALVRVRFNGNTAAEAERYPMGKRIREVEQGPNGDVWLLEDGTGARLLRLTPI
ncbi:MULTISPECIES: PQQ-dependent sugar dehydrogenase [Lysobacter]|jgi:glucose/arabinose dehydrogenase|uniref:PQQ-dependent sugar dehydrogenase n=1 Tax=Lysobacter TaxID=68 RepID=UPI001F3A1BE5|nr:MULTISPECIES: PQQ-dependent sugar dehydrogenase [Lysobacter]UJB20019.1 PQQ-dependent sugar dehydrogenase [Lysobacter capsici]UJQ30866.1 PQQ-dependent sugar dehydrogenase [Lysobacter gummosus]